jgi:hypothetical protein
MIGGSQGLQQQRTAVVPGSERPVQQIRNVA